MDEIKQVLVLRNDLGMGKGKCAAQAAHASILAYLKCTERDRRMASAWIRMGQKKIVVKVAGEPELVALYNRARTSRIPSAIVSDAGLTQLPPGTKTALGIGPWHGAAIDTLTSRLKLL